MEKKEGTITGYKIVLENSHDIFEEKVNKLIENRYYQPIGGVSMTTKEGVIMFAQAFVAKE